MRRQRPLTVSITFYLHKIAAKPETGWVRMNVRVNGKNVAISTSDVIAFKDFNPNTRRPFLRAGRNDLKAAADKMDRYEHEARGIFRDWNLTDRRAAAKVTPEMFRDELAYRLGEVDRPEPEPDKTKKIDESDFISFAESVRDQRKESSSIKRGTWKVLNNHVNLLREYIDLKHGGQLPFEKVDELFIDGLRNWLFRAKLHSRLTVHKVLITMRSIAIRAADRGLMKYGNEFKRWTKQDYREMPKIAFDRNELQKIIDLDLSDNPRLERVRDMFLIGVLTAQRRSDLKRLTHENFHQRPDGGYRYELSGQVKTGARASGTILSWGIPFLEKYGFIGDRPFNAPKIADQKFNNYLKEVVKMALPTATMIVHKDGEERDLVGTRVYKWEIVASHAARRTAVGLLRTLGAPDWIIQEATGHKTLSQMAQYDQREAVEIAITQGKTLDAAWQDAKMKAI